MSKRLLPMIGLMLIMVAATGCGLLQEPAAPSATIEAVPLEVTAPADAEPVVTDVQPTAESTAEQAGGSEAPAAEAPAATPRIFVIDASGSHVRFELDEDLRGQRTTVVGETEQVAGELSLDPNNLAQTQVGTLQINARTLLTDNNFRNRTIHNQILDTGGFEFITFTPTSVDGLPESVAIGDTVAFTITGDLTVRDVTLPATFTVEATLVSADQVTGTAGTVITRTDYGLRIPSVPNVANVEDEIELYIDFTANAS